MIVSPIVFIVAGLVLAVAIVALVAWAVCVTAAEDDEYESEHGFALPKTPEDVEAVLLTWDDIRNLPEVRP